MFYEIRNDQTPTETIHTALRILAGQCDFAQKADGVGFNAFDTIFGHQLADQPALTPGQAKAALKMLRKYSKQLADCGVELPADFDYDNSPTAAARNGRIYLNFPGKPDTDTRTWMKSVVGWKWEANLSGMPWSFPHTTQVKQAIFEKFGVNGIPDPEPVAQNTPQVEPVQQQPQGSRPEVKIDLDKAIIVSFPSFNRANVDKVKTLPERKYDPDKKVWIVPTRLAGKLVEMFPNAQGIEKLTALASKQKELADMSNQATGATINLTGLTGKLYPFQEVGVEFLDKANGRALIADEPGLGKTIQAIGYLAQHPELRPAVIIVPASLKINWRNEIHKWLSKPERTAVISGTKTYDLAVTGASIVIINYDILSKWQDQIIAWKPAIIISDESHFAKNPKSLRSKALKAITKAVSKTILLTGTPVTNRPAELFPLLNMLNPKDWSNFFKFAMRYCNAYDNGFGWDFSGASNLEELHEMTRPYIIRRRKDQVLTELPPKVWSNLVVEFDEKIRKEYALAVVQAEQEVSKLSSAQQLAMIEKMKQIAVKAKLPGIVDWITDFLETGEKLIVFATHKSTIKALEEAFPGIYVTITGDTAQNKRQDIVDRFQTDSNIRLFIGNIQAAGVGITLTAASNVLFVEFPWTPGDLMQSSDRAHRIGQKDSVTVYMAIAEGTIDEDITALLESKRQIIDTVHDGQVGENVQFGILDELVRRIMSRKG